MWPACVILRSHSWFWERFDLVYSRQWIYYLTDLTDDEKIATRRHCGYPAYGGTASGFSSWRFFQAYGLLEYRINNLADGEVNVVRTYLATLAGLEVAIPRSSDNLDTSQAAVWTRNQNEVLDRQRLFDDWRVRLCAFLGIPPGPGLRSNSPNLIV
jgi:hypothetical protein